LKILKILSTGDKTEKSESIYVQEIAGYSHQAIAEFRFKKSPCSCCRIKLIKFDNIDPKLTDD
jgi:hypothetical protein